MFAAPCVCRKISTTIGALCLEINGERIVLDASSFTSDVISLQLCFLAHSTSLPGATDLSWLAVGTEGSSITRNGMFVLDPEARGQQ
jgi:hypothetical protein